MFNRIEKLQEKKLAGQSLKMSLLENRTFELWSGFMPLRKQVTNQMGTALFSMQVYDQHLNFKDFNPSTTFSKWAAVEVSNFDNIPETLSS